VERKIDLEITDQTVEDILTQVFSEEGIEFQVRNDNLILLKPAGMTFGTFEFLAENGQQQRTVSGKITDTSNQPLPGVTVVIKGTTQGTVTNANGNYSLSNIPEDATLVFSFVGMRTVEEVVGSQTSINVTLEADVIGIEEVVAIGYGVTRKSDLTGSVSSVKGEELENIPASRVDQILQGKAAGVQVTQISGDPGTGSSIRIRGGNSIQGDNEPLYVIDGFIVGTGYNLNNINVNDIESLEVLKDATAISIYGTRGANGVILITTKSGLNRIPGKPVVQENCTTFPGYG